MKSLFEKELSGDFYSTLPLRANSSPSVALIRLKLQSHLIPGIIYSCLRTVLLSNSAPEFQSQRWRNMMIRNFYNSSNSGKFQIVKEIRKFDSVEIVYSIR